MQRSSSKMKWLGLAVLGCAACCAAPLLAMIGIGGGAASLSALFAGVDLESILCFGLLGAILVAGAYLTLRRFTKARASANCKTACVADGGCCKPDERRC